MVKQRKNINTSDYWDKRFQGGTMSLSRQVEKIVSSLIGDKLSILDIGCGLGRLLLTCKRDKDAIVYGIDISPALINHLHRVGISGEVKDANDLHTINQQFDVVLLIHVLEHVTDDENLIANVSRLTKKYAIICVPNNCMPPEEVEEHLRVYTEDILYGLLLKYFRNIKNYSFGVHLIFKCYK